VESTRQRLAQAQAACEQRNFAVAAACVADIIHARSPPSVVLCAARVAVGQGNVDHGLRLALGVLKQDAANADAYKASALALYLKGDLEQSQKHLKQLLKLNPDDTHAARTFKTVYNPVRSQPFHASACKRLAGSVVCDDVRLAQY
jgi:tetratricopeptide (TPR) repeat protein